MVESKDTTVIAADTHIKGEMSFQNTARIHGKFEGKINAKGELQVAEKALCAAEVNADNVVVDGSVEGNVRAAQKVTLNAKSSLKGDLVAERLVTAEGASIVGHVTVGANATGGAARPPAAGPQAQQPPRK